MRSANKTMKHEKLFELAKPYLERNDFGVAHTQRVFDIAKEYFRIPDNIEEKARALVILHDIGGSSIKEQYEMGPEIAAKLLKQAGYPAQIIEEVCEMIRTHHERLENPSEAFKILYDADQLAKFSKEEFYYYDSRNTDWNSIMNSMYNEHSKTLAKEWLKREED